MNNSLFIKALIVLIAFLLLDLYLICTSNIVHAYSVEIYNSPPQEFTTMRPGFINAGKTSQWKESVVRIDISSSLNEETRNETILHEIGHVIYIRSFTPKERRIYTQLYKSVKGRGCGNEYGSTTDWECYAELSTLMFAGKIEPQKDILYIYTHALMMKYKQKYLDILNSNMQ